MPTLPELPPDARRPAPRRPVRAFIHTLLFLVVLSSVALFLLSWLRGVPKPIERMLLEPINAGAFAYSMDRVHVHPVHGLYAVNVACYRKGMVGDPLVEADRVEFDIKPTALFRDRSAFVEGCRVVGGVIRHDPGPALPTTGGIVRRRARLHVELQDCIFEGVWIRQAAGEYALDGTRVTMRDVTGIAGRGEQSGTFRADVSFDRASKDYTFDGAFHADPYIMIPLLEGRGARQIADTIRLFTFRKRSPESRLRMAGSAARGAQHSRIDMDFSVQDSTYRGINITHLDVTAHAVITPTNRTLTLSPLRIMDGAQTLLGDVSRDMTAGRTSFRIVSSLHPYRAAALVSTNLEAFVRQFRFGPQTDLTARGVIYDGRPEHNDISMQAEGTGLGRGPITLARYALDLQVSGRTNHLTRLEGDLWEGRVKGWAIARPGADGGYTVETQGVAEDLAFDAFAKQILRAEGPRFTGRLSTQGDLIFPLTTNWLHHAQGRVRVDVREGALFRVPLFGGLTEILSRVIPGLDGLVEQTAAGATLTLRDGMAVTDSLVIEGNTLRIEGSGSYAFTNNLDFVMKLTVQKKTIVQRLIRIPLDLLSEVFFEVRLTGSTDKPRWYLRRFSRDLFERFDVKIGTVDSPTQDAEER